MATDPLKLDVVDPVYGVGLLGAKVSFVNHDHVTDARLYEIERLLLALCAVHGVEWKDGVLSRGCPKLLPIELDD